ncbi:ATP-binding protein [Campylobacter sp.]|uniref:ATP-binding protein n=1 Tax=Campylobacter sp. TaxID=205 RepID=UPI002AA69046|nr:ATP-binding protein [Campylobacter sp.]
MTISKRLKQESLEPYKKRKYNSIDPYKSYIKKRYEETLPKQIPSSVILREISEYGYTGKIRILQTYLSTLRNNIKQDAGFPKAKNIESFDFSATNVDEMQIRELLSLDFISKAENILMVGASGVGKTHLATAIGLKAVQNRIKTKFISLSDLMLAQLR